MWAGIDVATEIKLSSDDSPINQSVVDASKDKSEVHEHCYNNDVGILIDVATRYQMGRACPIGCQCM